MPATYTDNIDSDTDVKRSEDKFSELNSLIDDMRNAGMRVTNTWREMWTTAFKYAWGRQLQNITPQDDWNYIIINRIYPLMMSTVSKLAKNNPKVLTFPWDVDRDGATEFAEKWAGILQYIWESPYELSMRLKLIKGLLDAALFGYMVGKVFWDKQVSYNTDNHTWDGNVRHEFIHPATFWVDPCAENMEKAENCGTQRRVKLEWAINRWPEHKEAIEKEAYTSDSPKYVEGFEIIYDSQRASTLDENPKMMFTKIVDLILKRALHRSEDTAGGESKKQKYVTIEETYWKDYTTKHIKQEDYIPGKRLVDQGLAAMSEENGQVLDIESGELFPTEKWPKEVIDEYDEMVFPNGRFVLRIGKAILNPKEKDQQYRYSRWPFTVMPYHVLPHMWQGCNAVEMARNNNDMLNLTISSLVHRVRLAADPERLLEEGALAKDREGKVRQKKPKGLGKFILVNAGKIDKIKNMDYGRLDPAIMLLAQIIKQDIDDTMFSQDVARGAGSNKTPMQKGTGKMTATEASKLDVNSHDYIAMQAIFLDVWIDLTLTLIAEIVQMNYSEGRMVRIISDKEERTREKLTQGMLDIRFDVNIVPGSTMPFDKERKKENYMIAHKILANPMPHPSLEETLQVLEISNRKKILQRHQGTIMFSKFLQLSQMLARVDSKEIQSALQLIPELQPLYELMTQVAQLQIPAEASK